MTRSIAKATVTSSKEQAIEPIVTATSQLYKVTNGDSKVAEEVS